MLNYISHIFAKDRISKAFTILDTHTLLFPAAADAGRTDMYDDNTSPDTRQRGKKRNETI